MTTAGNHPTDATAPWRVTGEAYWFFLPTPATIPEGAYAPLESDSVFASPEAGKFRGGLGTATVQVVRYTDTPAGSYDELAYIPGTFDTPSGKAHLRVTRIYVSTDASTYNGRKNWNIPKHVARFVFTRISRNSPTKIEVFPPTPADSRPFFSAIATPSTWIPSFPLNTRYFPLDTLFVHPPLPSQGPDAYSVVGTEQWIALLPSGRGTAEFVWYKPGGDGSEGIPHGEYADGVGFPRFSCWSLGIHIKNLVFDIPAGRVVEGKKTK